MKRSKHILQWVFPSVAMLMLILDSKTALQGAKTGLVLCGQTIIPALFPFFVISILLTGVVSSYKIPIFQPILRFCKMPEGSETLLIVGFLGGYPVGAKCIYDKWKQGQISKVDAHRCLAFCSNAGPAFIFGMCGMLFSGLWFVFVLWGIHIVSALLVGYILPGNSDQKIAATSVEPISVVSAVSQAVNAMLNVCSWVVLFRVIIAFCDHWFLWLIPQNWCVAAEGLLELANGCNALVAVGSEGIRFVLCAGFLGFGGLCVTLQTVSVVGELGIGRYFSGKVLQCLFSSILALLFASVQYHLCSPILPFIMGGCIVLLVVLKKRVDFPKRHVYNVEKNWKGDFLCYSGRKLPNPAAIAPAERK